MAGNMTRPPSIGVGSALRRARELRGATLDEAARDTRLRVEQLRALEDEDFEALGEEVYVRAVLRTYSQYLGLDTEKVIRVYGRHADEPGPPPPPAKLGRVEQAIAATRVRDNQRFLLIAAFVVLVTLVAVGFVSRGGSPEPGDIATDATEATAGLGVAEAALSVSLEASAPVTVEVVVDGEERPAVTLGPGEVLALNAVEELRVAVSDGGAVVLTVNGVREGVPGAEGAPWSQTFVSGGV
jgi:cytoskeletal protein RodZ